MTTFLMLGAGMAVVSLVIFSVLHTLVARPLHDITAAARRLASGDTSTRAEIVDSTDEVGELSRAFDNMMQSWKSMAETAKRVADGDLSATLAPRSQNDVFVESFNILVESMSAITTQFREAVYIVSSTSSEILVSVNQSAVGANETATAANETSAIVEEVRQTSHVASQKAKQVSDSAQKTAQITAAGRKATEDIIEGMNRIREQVDLIAEAMVRLSEKSQSISGIIATVDDLAKQSNLLAVNASIEAARAGELGRGFGVVALEVKNMAEQSKQSTAQVRAIIAEIQQATNAAAMATELGGKAVDAALQQSGRAGESIAVLAGSVLESAQTAAQIAVSNQQQLAGVDQVAAAMSSIRDACEEHILAIRHVEDGANRLNEIGAKLKLLVDRYDSWSNLENQYPNVG
jgi:methyl-accepting chemotaxis protein